jgi:two-component system, sensor histidine kinase and response regulator
MGQKDTSTSTTSSSPTPLAAKTSVKRLMEVGSGVVSFFADRIGRQKHTASQHKEPSSSGSTSLDSSSQASKPGLSPSSRAALAPGLRIKPLNTPPVVLESIPFRVRTAIEDAVKRCVAQAKAKGIELTCLLSHEAPTPMRGDPGHLRRIIITLLEETIARMEHGEIIVRSTLLHQTPLQATFRFSITTMPLALTHKGTGWSKSSEPDLSTAKHLVTLLRGEMGQEGQPDIGTTYWFSVTFDKQPPKAIATPPPRTTLNGVRALIFGDLLASFSDHFLKWGMPGHFSKDATQTMQMLVTAAQSRSAYDVALLTCQQLDPTILKLVTSIRTTPALSALRLVLLTATGKKGDAQRAHRAGIDAYLAMPMTPTEVFDCLTTALSAPARSLNLEAPLITRYTIAELKAQNRAHILIIDPTHEDQKNTARVLEELGYSADVVTNGQEAFAAYSQASYAAVLLACPLPQREGFTITAHIRQHDRQLHTSTPIIGLATSDVQGKIDTLRQPGMDDIITKPVTVTAIKKTLERCTKDATSVEVSRPSLDTSAVCDLETALAHLDGDRELFSEMIALFLEEYPLSLAKMNQAIAANDPQSLTYSANALRGALSHFHATGAMALTLHLEQCGRKGDLSQVTPLLTQLENILPRVASILVNAHVTITA